MGLMFLNATSNRWLWQFTLVTVLLTNNLSECLLICTTLPDIYFDRNFPRSNPTVTDESDSSSGREPCLQDDEDCDMFSGDVVSIETPPQRGRKNDGVVFVRTSSTTIAATIRQIQTTMPMMTAATVTSRAKKRRTTAPNLVTTMTPALKLSSPAPATTTSLAMSQSPSPPMLLTVPSLIQTTAQHPVLQQPTRTSHEPKGDIGSKAFGSHAIDNGPNSGRVHGNGPDVTRIGDIDRLKWNVGLIIAVAICLAILFLVLAFVIYRFRGVAVTGHRALHHHHHRHSQSGVTGSKVAGNETKGTDYVYETCNTLPVTPVSTELSRPLVINRSANIATAASSSATATLLPQQNHHHHHQQQPQQQQQQVSNGSRKEVKEWYVWKAHTIDTNQCVQASLWS